MKEAPILVRFLLGCRDQVSQELTDVHRTFIYDIVARIKLCYEVQNKPNLYCPAENEGIFRKLSFFPVLPKLHKCCDGYSLDLNKANVDVTNINSQVNEQANAGLVHLKSQLAYMKPENFMRHIALFLAIKN
ncbi:uncharacterized protein LOC141905314 [Tubulanus polymorphus]|uniref:uncharacterized protein LOC141905314 n=1 Tax=Tubulanus polymorphus TaxID=672921 RepID=UPI003DA5D24D